MFHSEVVVE